MPLGFQIKFFYLLWIVNSLWVNFFVSNQNGFPDSLIGFLKCDIDEFLILDAPERIFDLHFLLELTIQDWFVLTLDLNKQTLRLDFDVHHLWSCTLWDWNLDCDLLDSLRPVIFLSAVTVVCTDFLHIFYSLCLNFLCLFLLWFLLWGLLRCWFLDLGRWSWSLSSLCNRFVSRARWDTCDLR